MRIFSLNTKFLGKKVIYYKTIDSTQLEVWRMIEKEEIENGTIVATELQTKGRRDTW